MCFGIFNICFSPAKSKQIALSLIYNFFLWKLHGDLNAHVFLFAHSWLSARRSMKCCQIQILIGKQNHKFKFGESNQMMGKLLPNWSPLVLLNVSLYLKKRWRITRYCHLIWSFGVKILVAGKYLWICCLPWTFIWYFFLFWSSTCLC